MSLKKLSGRGWLRAEPPSLSAEDNVIAVVSGTEIRAAPEFEMKESPVVDTPSEIHRRFRSGMFDLDIRLQTTSDMVTEGFIKVERADGY